MTQPAPKFLDPTTGNLTDTPPRGFENFVPPPDPVQYETRADAILAVRQWLDGLTQQVTAKYSDAEMRAWDKMEAAATAFHSQGDQAPAAQLAMLDDMRRPDETRESITTSILQNAARFTAIAALVRKIRSETTAQINAASTPAEWETVVTDALSAAASAATTLGLTSEYSVADSIVYIVDCEMF